MTKDKFEDPSDISKAANGFLNSLTYSPKTKKTYENVITLFISRLKHDGSAVTESEDGTYLLKNNWADYDGGIFSGFIERWIPRKVICGKGIKRQAPIVLKRFVVWSYKKGYLNKGKYEEYIGSFRWK